MTGKLISLHRERQRRRPVLERYRGPMHALRGAQYELGQLLELSDQSLLVDSCEVQAVALEVLDILAEVAKEQTALDALRRPQQPGQPERPGRHG